MKDSRRIEDLQPVMRARVILWRDDCLAEAIDVLITCTIRSFETQAIIYTWGRTVKNPNSKGDADHPLGKIATWKKPGQSSHQHGYGLDFAIVTHGKLDWSGDSPPWNRAIELAKARGLKSLRPFESAHLEEPNWEALVHVT